MFKGNHKHHEKIQKMFKKQRNYSNLKIKYTNRRFIVWNEQQIRYYKRIDPGTGYHSNRNQIG